MGETNLQALWHGTGSALASEPYGAAVQAGGPKPEAGFAPALGRGGSTCNAVAIYYHDHHFVSSGRRDAAIAALRDLANV